MIIEFLRSVLAWLKQRGSLENIGAQLLDEVQHICEQFLRYVFMPSATNCLDDVATPVGRMKLNIISNVHSLLHAVMKENIVL